MGIGRGGVEKVGREFGAEVLVLEVDYLVEVCVYRIIRFVRVLILAFF